MLKTHNETFFGLDCKFSEADVVIFGAPFDSTTSFRPGARFASRVMRSESYGLESYSPYQDIDILDCSIMDSGDLELPFGSPKPALKAIESRTAKILSGGKIPVMIGGEHLVSLGAIRAAAAKYPNLRIIHFDAHTDLRDEYLGEKLSHASVIRRAWDIVGDGRIYQFGIRSGEKAEFEWAKAHTQLTKFDFDGLDDAVTLIGDKPVYLTIDLDVLDPSVFPGTGTPEAGGVAFVQLLGAMLKACKLNIVACDINELAPTLDQSGASTATALKVLRELLIAIRRK